MEQPVTSSRDERTPDHRASWALLVAALALAIAVFFVRSSNRLVRDGSPALPADSVAEGDAMPRDGSGRPSQGAAETGRTQLLDRVTGHERPSADSKPSLASVLRILLAPPEGHA